MLKSDVQHQFWVTKKAVQRKLGTKEDKHIISSDAELDAKIEVFKSIAETSNELCKIIDQYQERLCILSQEECIFGRFLKEAGKRSKSTGSSISNTGKAMSFAGQQRMCVRVPLLRLHHEVDVFRCRAVKDTENTLQSMEKERTEYRAALSWMKSASTELDPDTGKGLDKFRTAQTHVRSAKQNFDTYSMDSIQKIDLLAAARCNMYSHALVAYVNELKTFAQKASSTFKTISNALTVKPKYDFCVLKELTQSEGEAAAAAAEGTTTTSSSSNEPVDKDQSLFFASEYHDDATNENTTLTATTTTTNEMESNVTNESLLIELSKQMEESPLIDAPLNEESAAAGGGGDNNTKFWSRMFSHPGQAQQQQQQLQQPLAQQRPPTALPKASKSQLGSNNNAWLELFADLDPLANMQAFDLKLNEGRNISQQT